MTIGVVSGTHTSKQSAHMGSHVPVEEELRVQRSHKHVVSWMSFTANTMNSKIGIRAKMITVPAADVI